MNGAVFLRNILTLSGGKAFASLFTILLTPLIARIFTPEDFGIAAFFVAACTILNNVSTLRYANAVVLPKKDSQAATLVVVSIGVAAFYCIVFEILIGFWSLVDPNFALVNKLGFWAFVLAGFVFLLAIDDALTFWLVRIGKFKRIALSDLFGPIATGTSRLAFGHFFGSSVTGLIAGLLVGQLVRLFLLVELAWKNLKIQGVLSDKRELFGVANSYKDYPEHGAPTSLVFVTSNQLPLIVLGFLYDPAILGFYAMANRLLQSPIQTVSGGVRKVFLKKTSDLKNKGKRLTMPWVKLAAALVVLGLPPFGILLFYSEEIMALLLGEQWRAAGEVVTILVPWLFLVWVSLPCAVVVEVYRKQKQWFRLQSVTLVLRSSVFGLAYLWEKDYLWAISGFAAVSSVAILVNMGFLYSWTLKPPQAKSSSDKINHDQDM